MTGESLEIGVDNLEVNLALQAMSVTALLLLAIWMGGWAVFFVIDWKREGSPGRPKTEATTAMFALGLAAALWQSEISRGWTVLRSWATLEGMRWQEHWLLSVNAPHAMTLALILFVVTPCIAYPTSNKFGVWPTLLVGAITLFSGWAFLFYHATMWAWLTSIS